MGFWVAITRNGLGHRVALLADGDLALLHHLEQRRLHLGRGPVDLVGEQEVAEHGAQLGVEGARVRPVDPGADAGLRGPGRA